MVELADAGVMNKKMLKKLKRHHGHRHTHDRGHEHHHDGDEVLRGVLASNGNEILVVLSGKHHHHHHHHHHFHHPDPSGFEAKFHDGEEEEKLHANESKHQHRRERQGRLIGGHRAIEGTVRGLKHHVKRHRHIYKRYCRGLGLDFQYHNNQLQGTEAGAVGGAPVTPEAELMMKNLSLAEGKESNKD